MNEPPRRVCIVLLTGLGDVVMGLPVASALKAANPRCHITWIAEPVPAQVLHPHPAVDEVVVFHRSEGLKGVADLWSKMRGRRFDLTLNLNIYFKSIWPTVFSGAPRRIGFERGRARDGTWLASNEHLRPGPRRHTVDMFLEFLDQLGVRGSAPDWSLPLTEQEQTAQREFFGPLAGRPVVSIVPASAIASKDWRADRWAQVADALAFDFGWQVMLVGGPGEREGRIAREITDRSRAKPIWALGDGVRRVTWLLAGSSLVISPDTGPVHVARALRVPLIGLYGHTNPWRVGPYRWCEDLWVDRYTNPGEAPDPSSFDPHPGRMEQISVADVLERVERARSRVEARAA